MSKVKFEKEEIDLLSQPEYFLLKKRLEVKINDLLTLCIPFIQKEMDKKSAYLPQKIPASTPKISRGENYLSFPWQILDYPRIFGKENTFALRTLCWFGNGISLSLLLGGDIAKLYVSYIEKNFSLLMENNFYICIHKDPFQHHFEENNIIRCSQFFEGGNSIHELLEQHQFIKIVKLYSFEEIDSIPEKIGQASRILFDVLFVK